MNCRGAGDALSADPVVPPCHAARVIVDFTAELWNWDARRLDSWTFVSLPAEASEEIRDHTAGHARGFGAVRVRVTIGATTWQTSIFPDAARGTYVLPVKKAVRRAESLEEGDRAAVRVELIQA